MKHVRENGRSLRNVGVVTGRYSAAVLVTTATAVISSCMASTIVAPAARSMAFHHAGCVKGPPQRVQQPIMAHLHTPERCLQRLAERLADTAGGVSRLFVALVLLFSAGLIADRPALAAV